MKKHQRTVSDEIETKITVEAALNAELDDHLGFDKYEQSESDNNRNGVSHKTLQTEGGQFELATPRDRAGGFEPQLVKKHQPRFTSMDDKILFLYAQGLAKRVIDKAVYRALGVNMEGHKELLGLWLAENECAKFWLNVLTELQNRGVRNILIACVDGLKGFPDAINTAYPETHIQLCIVHIVCNSMKYVPWNDYKYVAADLKRIYQSATEEEALLALD